MDAGLSKRELTARLASIGEAPDRLSAILVTHEHSDHVGGLIPLAREWKLPIYMTRLTAPSVAWGEFEPRLELFQAGSRFAIGDIGVQSFTVPHDAVDPVGFCLEARGIRIGIATDLGYLPDSIRVHLRGADVLLLESNHDTEMLKVGPYPWSVKQRVMGRMGHLSNEVAGEFIRNGLDLRTSTVILGHLSEHNNHPAIVRQVGEQALAGRTLFTRLVVADPRRPSEVFEY